MTKEKQVLAQKNPRRTRTRKAEQKSRTLKKQKDKEWKEKVEGHLEATGVGKEPVG